VSFEQVLEKRKKQLPPLYTDLCQIGIKSGNLPAVLETFASFAIKEKGFRDKLRLMTIYPVIVLIFSVITAVIVIGVMPESADEMLSSGKSAYSFSIKNIVSDAVFIFVNCGIAVWIVMLLAGFRNPLFNKEAFIWRFPPAKYLKLSALSAMFYYLATNGIPLSQIPGIVKNIINDNIIRTFLEDVETDLKKGKDFVEALQDNIPSVIPHTWLWMIQMSKGTNSIEQNFAYLEKYYREKADIQMRIWIGGLLPVLTAVGGGFVFVNIYVIIQRFIPLIAAAVKGAL
ncbi:type II secretion system F family protein, partial [Planctomycetota bacterium]